MIRYLQTMMRDEPITLLVMMLMIGLLLFGAWNALPTPKKSSALEAGDLVATIGQAPTILVA